MAGEQIEDLTPEELKDIVATVKKYRDLIKSEYSDFMANKLLLAMELYKKEAACHP
jgi:hypothetical protein